MAIEQNRPAADDSLPPGSIPGVLSGLRRQIRWYVTLEGIAWVLVVVAAIFWVTLGLNWGYFKLSRLELPKWFRAALGVGAVLLVVAVFSVLLVRRLIKSMRAKALALVLERRFPELDDRLITAVEAHTAKSSTDTALTRVMLARTVSDVDAQASKLPVRDVFRGAPLWRALVIAVVLVGSVIGFGLWNREAVGYWYQAFFKLEDEYWDRETRLDARVIGEPALIAQGAQDRIREFDGEQVYKHPRGSDFTLSVLVPEGVNGLGNEWKVPDEVYLDYELDEGRGGAEITMTPWTEGKSTGPHREFRQTVSKLLDNMTFVVKGGDFVSRKRFRVEVVDPPGVDVVRLESAYPNYTNRNPPEIDPSLSPADRAREIERRREESIVESLSVSLPLETQLTFHGESNKPLVGVRVETDRFHLIVSGVDENGQPTQEMMARLRLLSEDGQAGSVLPLRKGFAEQMLMRGQKEFHLPLDLTGDAVNQLTPPTMPHPALPGWLSAATTAVEMADWSARPRDAIPLAANTLLRIYLEDTDAIVSRDPARLTINGVVDNPPVIETEFEGIGEFITRSASIPVKGTISDDYGVAQARFEYRVVDKDGLMLTGPNWQKRDFAGELIQEDGVLTLNADDTGVQRFSVRELQISDSTGVRPLKTGETLQLMIWASDADNLNGPNWTRGRPKPEFTFKVVSPNELLDILYERELGYLARFEQIMEEVRGVQRDLNLAKSDADQLFGAGGVESAESRTIRSGINSISKRSIQQLNKNSGETKDVRQGFESVLQELANNSIESKNMVQSLRELIVEPLHGITDNDFPAADTALVQFRNVHEEGRDPREAIGNAQAEVDSLLQRLDVVYQEMLKLVGYQELLRNLNEMIGDAAETRRLTEEEQRRIFEEDLKRLQDLQKLE